MPSKREQALSALFGRLGAMALVTVKRNEALPQTVPAAGLVILRDGDFGEPDVTLNPVHLFFSHRAEIDDRSGAEEDVLAYVTFPKEHRTKLHSTNPLERLNEAIRRQTNVVGVFPNEVAVTRSVGDILIWNRTTNGPSSGPAP